MFHACISKTLIYTLVFVFISLALHIFFNYNEDFIYKKNTITNQISTEFIKHCNFLENIQINDETNILDKFNFQLEKVIALIRHGDRAPLRLVKNLEYLNCDKSYLKNDNYDDFFKKLVDNFIQNKPNFVKLNFSNDLTDFPDEKCMLARLTKFGVSQHVKLGYLLSVAYSSRLNLTDINANDSLKVITTNVSRTFQSALSFLFGFFSQLNSSIENFPKFLYSYNSYFCGINESSLYCSRKCSTISKLRDELSLSNLLDDAELASINGIVENLGKIIAPNTKELSKYTSIVSIFDGINAYLCHHEKLPCHPYYGCVSSNHAKDVFSYICLIGKKFQHSRAYKHSSWLKIYGFLNNLIKEIYDPSKFVIFSGHDISLEPLKSVLAFHDCNIPPYASRIIFEVYSQNSKKYLRIIYNGDEITQKMDIDKHLIVSFQGVQLIDVELFQQYVQEKFKFFTHTDDYKMACGGNDLESESDDKEFLEV